jgi:cation diffusion facilitator CzcD-associated flavoprotein CzcO
MPTTEHFDVLIVGAGLSGIGAACHLQTDCPGKRYAILEGRDRSGGTWDLFQYPGIRSDSDMFTLGYSFKPWTEAKAIADGPSILSYIRETAREHGVEQHIRYSHRVVRADWSSADARWTVEVQRSDTGETQRLTCGFLFGCTGYYRYDKGYTPFFEGRKRFRGEIVHPQHWPEGFDYSDKRVVVIGSGATAVTLVPSMAAQAAHVTMLQRSPTRCRAATRSPTSCAASCRRESPIRSCAGRTCCCRARCTGSADARRASCARCCAEASRDSSRPATTSRRTSTRSTTRGTSASASCPTPTCSRRSGMGAPPW